MKELVKDLQPLRVTDRCDRCPGQAFFRIMGEAGYFLDFCGHHADKYEAALIGAGFFKAEDNRDLLLSGQQSVKKDGKDVG
jgi:hypothetical protein